MVEIVLMDIDKIKPYENNARVHKDTVDKLVKHIKEVGFNVPLVVDKNGVIVKGHARLKAGKKLGLKKLPVIISPNSDEKNKLDRILDNKIHELSDWRVDLLNYELDDLQDYMRELNIEFGDIDIDFDTSYLDVNEDDIERAKEKVFATPEKGAREYTVIHCEECGGAIKYVRN